ncbi:MAG: hypothetical protein M3203_05360 [Actinomycetota bacterium]|nr:hypothetical protein [Actinomycetota bacterium]
MLGEEAMAGPTQGTFGRSGAGLMDYLEWQMRSGRVSPQEGANRIVACNDILRIVLGHDWTRTDVTVLDMDEVRRQISAIKGETQLSRFEEYCLSAIEDFKEYSGISPSRPSPEPPPSPRIPSPEPSPPPSAPDDPSKRLPAEPQPDPIEPPIIPAAPNREVPPMSPSPVLPSLGVIPHLFPLRNGVLATLLLPADLNSEEASRLSGFIQALAMPDISGTSIGGTDANPNGSISAGVVS